MVVGPIRKAQIVSAILRMLPLAAKLALTLYMGRFLSLSDMGVYGLVLGAVLVTGSLIGQGVSYVVARDIVDVAPLTALHRIRDQAILNGINYIALIIIALTINIFGLSPLQPLLLLLTITLIVLESLAGAAHINMNSLNLQVPANISFFVRAGLWVFPVIILGLMNPAYRTVYVVLIGWLLGALTSLGVVGWYWRHMPWAEAIQLPVDWPWIKTAIRKCWLIWLGGLGLMVGTYTDRFIVSHFLTMDDVGVLTFYFSFANAMLTLTQSGVLAFSAPRLITIHRQGDTIKFDAEARQAFWQVALGAGLVAVGLGVVVPLLGLLTHREALMASETTFWLMLFGTWIRANAETFNNILYARHQDRAVWLGNILFLIPALGGNALFVPWLGLPGIGWGTISMGSFLFIWRWLCIRRHNLRTGAA